VIVVVGKIEVESPEDITRIEEALKARMTRTRAEPGNLDYSFSVEIGTPTVMYVNEKWVNQAALNAHLDIIDDEFSAAISTAHAINVSLHAYAVSSEQNLF
jgi:quinol monooxygenase YgiN